MIPFQIDLKIKDWENNSLNESMRQRLKMFKGFETKDLNDWEKKFLENLKEHKNKYCSQIPKCCEWLVRKWATWRPEWVFDTEEITVQDLKEQE